MGWKNHIIRISVACIIAAIAFTLIFKHGNWCLEYNEQDINASVLEKNMIKVCYKDYLEYNKFKKELIEKYNAYHSSSGSVGEFVPSGSSS